MPVQRRDGTWVALGDPGSLLSGIGGKGGIAQVRAQETFQKVLKWEQGVQAAHQLEVGPGHTPRQRECVEGGLRRATPASGSQGDGC